MNLTVEQIEQAKFDADNPAQAEMRLRRANFDRWNLVNPIDSFTAYTGPQPEHRKPKVIDPNNRPGRKKVIPPPATDAEREIVNGIITEACKKHRVSVMRLLASRRVHTHPARRGVITDAVDAGVSVHGLAEILGMSVNSIRLAVNARNEDRRIAASVAKMKGRAA